MSNGPDGLIRINPVFSRWLAFYLVALHLSALLVLLLLHLSLVPNLIMSVCVCLSLIYYWKRDLLHQGRGSISSVKWSEEGGWLISDNNGTEQFATLSPSSFLSQYLVLLSFKTANNDRRRLLLPGDGVDPDQLRRLRVLLISGCSYQVS
jgi:Membrane-bound toxin component of toxin-antitoxin system